MPVIYSLVVSRPIWVVLLCLGHLPPALAQFTQQGSDLVGTNGGGARQGNSVALSADGNTALIGGPHDNALFYFMGLAPGAAWVFNRTNGVWAQQGPKLFGASGVGNQNQGTSVALSGDGNTALVGGPFDNNNTGAAWVFTRTNGVWGQQDNKLVPTDASSGAGVSTWVALSADGNTAILGEPRCGSSLAATASGASNPNLPFPAVR